MLMSRPLCIKFYLEVFSLYTSVFCLCLPVFFREKLYVGQAWLKQISWTCVSLSWRNFNKPSPVGVGLNEASLVKPDLFLFVKRAEQSWRLPGGFRNCLLNFKRTMVGKARSSNFTLSEKLDLLKLVKPYVKILEEHTNKHSVIVEKNRCWDIIAVNYNAIGVDRPPRTAQGLRTLYKRLKEYAKQELSQQKETQSDLKSNISEPTKKVMEMIPQISSFCLVRDRNHIQR